MTITERVTAAVNALKGKQTDTAAALADMTKQRDSAVKAAQVSDAAAQVATDSLKTAQSDLSTANTTITTLQGQLAAVGDVVALGDSVTQLETLAAS